MRTNQTRRRVLAGLGTAGVSFLAGCSGVLGGSDDEGSTGLPLELTNQLTQATIEGSLMRFYINDREDDTFPVHIEVVSVDRETLAETTLFEREPVVTLQENRQWDDALTVDESVDEYVLKARLAPGFGENEGGDYASDIYRFKPDETTEAVGETLDVWVGGVSNGLGADNPGVLAEPDETQT